MGLLYIAHSIGPSFIASYLADNDFQAKNLFLIAPVFGKINAPDYDYVNASFFECSKLNMLPNLTKKRICYISRTDPYVPNALSENFAKLISAEKLYCDAGHFNTVAGYTTFEQLLKDVLSND